MVQRYETPAHVLDLTLLAVAIMHEQQSVTSPVHSEYRKGGHQLSLISNFRLVLNVVCFLLGNSPAYEFYYADVLEHSVCSIFIGRYLPAYEDGTEFFKTSAYKLQTPGNYPEEIIHQLSIFPLCFKNV